MILISLVKLFFIHVRVKLHILIISLILGLFGASYVYAQGKFLSKRDSLTILASPSLTHALADVSREFALNNKTVVSLYFAESEELTEMIELGEAADVIITDDTNALKQLKMMGLVALDSQEKIGESELILVSSSTSKLAPFTTQIKKLDNFKDIMGYVLSKSFVVSSDLNNSFSGFKIKDYLSENGVLNKTRKRLISAQDNAEAAYLITKGSHAGIVCKADIFGNNEVNTLFELDKNIAFYASAVAGNKMQLARDYITYLNSEDSQKIFKGKNFN